VLFFETPLETVLDEIRRHGYDGKTVISHDLDVFR